MDVSEYFNKDYYYYYYYYYTALTLQCVYEALQALLLQSLYL